MKKLFSTLCIIIFSIIAFISCEKNTESVEKPKIAEAFPGVIGQIVDFVNNQDTISCEKINGEYIFQGDIILTETQLDDFVNSKGGAIASLSKRWPNNTVYFTINENVTKRERIVAAIAAYHSNTNIKFENRTTEENYVEFTRSSDDGTWSNLGMINGKQKIVLADWADEGSVIHEIGHTVGLIHEHSRSDRDQFVKIITSNIQSGKKHNFRIVKNSINSSTFDWNSIMLYPYDAFSKNPTSTDISKLATITKLDGTLYPINNTNLSSTDIELINTLYPTGGQISQTGLVVFYPFNGNANDESGNSLNGTVYGALLTADKNGNANKAYSFNGSTNYISSPHNSLLNFGTSNFSIYALIKTGSIPPGSWSAIISKHNTATNHDTEFFLMIEGGTGKPYFGLSTNTGVFDRIYGPSSICNNKYHALCGIKENGILKFYLDGKLIGTKSTTINPNNTNPLNVGRSSYNSGYGYFNGIIDEIRIYSRALTLSEIQLLGNWL